MILFSFDCAVCCSLDFSLVTASGSSSPVVVYRLLVAVASFLAEHMGSVVTLNGLSCLASCGIFPYQRSNPCALHCQANSLPLSHQGSPILQSWLLWFCSKDYSKVRNFSFVLPDCFWLFWVPFISGWACPFLQKQLEFWWRLHWICRSIWGVFPL